MEKKPENTKDIVYVSVGLGIIALNIAEIRFISRIKHKKTFDKLLLSLAVSDIFVGISVAVFKVLDLTFDKEDLAWTEESAFAQLFLFSLTFSFTNLLAISIDRYLAVKFPIKHRIIVTPKCSNIAILFVWLISLVPLVLSLLLIVLWSDNSEYFLQVSSIVILIFGAFLVAIYATILLSIYRNRVKTLGRNLDGKTKWQKLISIFKAPGTAERSVFFSCCFVASSFILSTYPFGIEYLVTQSGNDISFVSKLLILLNSLLNPFTYFFKSYLCPKSTKTVARPIELS